MYLYLNTLMLRIRLWKTLKYMYSTSIQINVFCAFVILFYSQEAVFVVDVHIWGTCQIQQLVFDFLEHTHFKIKNMTGRSVHSKANATSLGSIQPHCNYYAKTIRSHIHHCLLD